MGKPGIMQADEVGHNGDERNVQVQVLQGFEGELVEQWMDRDNNIGLDARDQAQQAVVNERRCDSLYSR